MGETKHTPGPWSVDDNVDVIGPDRDWIATVRVEHLTRPAEGPPNAKLIAAAPEMAEALAPLLDYHDVDHIQFALLHPELAELPHEARIRAMLDAALAALQKAGTR